MSAIWAIIGAIGSLIKWILIGIIASIGTWGWSHIIAGVSPPLFITIGFAVVGIMLAVVMDKLDGIIRILSSMRMF